MKKYIFDILRRKSPEDASYRQLIEFETEEDNETVATALIKINNGHYLDSQGNTVEEIIWEAGCLQKKCGACAMLINGSPALACDTFLRNLKKNTVKLAPLSKFPVIRDLAADRSIMMDNLKTLKVWTGENGELTEKNLGRAFDASICLQCGCCLEACPNFYNGGSFYGAAAFAPEARLLSAYSEEEKKTISNLYNKHIYEGCGKSLACQKVCPAGINLDRLLSRSNAVSVWKKLIRSK